MALDEAKLVKIEMYPEEGPLAIRVTFQLLVSREDDLYKRTFEIWKAPNKLVLDTVLERFHGLGVLPGEYVEKLEHYSYAH